MRKAFLIFSILWAGSTAAFFLPETKNDALSYPEKKIHIEVIGSDTIHGEISMRIQNKTQIPQSLQLLQPLPEKSENIHFFMDAAGGEFDILEGEVRLEKIFNFAVQHQNSHLFRFGRTDVPKLFLSREMLLGGEQSVLFKLTFDFPSIEVGDFRGAKFFLDETQSIENFELSFSLAPGYTIQKFLSSFTDEAFLDVQEKIITGIVKKVNYTPSSEIFLLWTDNPAPKVSASFQGFTYESDFSVQFSLPDIQEVSILIDRSGSVSGAYWERIKECVHFLLESLGEQKKVRIGFFDEYTEWYSSESRDQKTEKKEEFFVQNTFDFRKEFSTVLNSTKPLGKTNVSSLFQALQEGWGVPPEQRLTILLTDEKDVPTQSSLASSLLLFYFGDSEGNQLFSLARASGGFAIKLFGNALSFVEKEEFLGKWNNWREKIASPISHDELQEILPSSFLRGSYKSNPFFVGRKSEQFHPQETSLAYFLPRVWGMRKIGEILQKFQSPDSTELGLDSIDALLALGRTFGVQIPLFDETTSRGQLQQKLKDAKITHALSRIILDLENPDMLFPPTRARFVNGIPLYLENQNPGSKNPEPGFENIWEQFDYPDRVNPDTLIEIAPFSEAQRQLFVQFPEFVAEGFGVGNNVNFCTDFRCISVADGARQEPTPQDRAFFRDFDPTHWAAGYAVRGVNLGLLEPELNGKLNLNKAIDRGEFVQMVVKAFQKTIQPGFRNLEPGLKDLFSDVSSDSKFYEPVQILANSGVINGYGDGTFRPLQSLTRAEAVKILLASNGFEPRIDLNPGSEFLEPGFVDVFKDVTGWESPWVAEAAKRNIVKGYPDKTFRPHQNLTRAEALKIVLEMK
ncbi:S-layer homology domain-containing protein [Candidatus Gracilibacteria bacterium]|nr:S-layer homology domain-containing protein [Candidatus Gracilibacteria bacterium]